METDENNVNKRIQAGFADPGIQWHHNIKYPRKPKLILSAIQTTVKAGKHYWHYHNELVPDLHHIPDECIHSLNTCMSVFPQ